MPKTNFASYLLAKPWDEASFDQKQLLEKTLPWLQSLFQLPNHKIADDEVGRDFLFPMIKLGLAFEQIQDLCLKIPSAWPLDHREIYYDFRLERWMKHIEPLTLPECIREYIRNSINPEQAENYLRSEFAKALTEIKNENI